MTTAYFDCFSGVSGNMILGALVDLGLDLGMLNDGVRSLGLADYRIEVSRVKKNDIAAVYANVITADECESRSIGDILTLIDQSSLDDGIRSRARRIFIRLAEAEAKVHGCEGDQAKLHEVGSNDTVIDVVGSLVGLKALGVDQIGSSFLNLGGGTVRCHHGLLPVPAPVTAELLKGFPTYSSGEFGELTTPTGAAIVTTLAGFFGPMPVMRVGGVGYGAGKMDLDVPNALRIFLGDRTEAHEGRRAESVVVLETNIDDMSPQLYEHIMESLLDNGALDVFMTPVQMKKNRPGVLLSVIAPPEITKNLLDIILREGTTLGVRVAEMERLSLPRSTRIVQTKFGPISVKLAERGDGVVTMSPEYDDCRRASREHGAPLAVVYGEVQRVWQNSLAEAPDV